MTKDGELVAFAPESQSVRAWEGAEKTLKWQFQTLYPPSHGDLLPDGTLLVSSLQAPDLTCLDATAAAERVKQPLAPYWNWLAVGIAAALIVTSLLQWPTLRQYWNVVPTDGSFSANTNGTGAPPSVSSGLSPARRVEIGLYVLGATALAVAAAFDHRQLLLGNRVDLWSYAAFVLGAGLFLVMLQYRVPRPNDEWIYRMERLERMQTPTWRMWTLWILGIVLLAVSLEGVYAQRGQWVVAPWSAGLILLFGGAIQPPTAKMRIRPYAAIAGLFIIGGLLFVRVYHLEEHPPNLHLDMAQWTVHTLRLLSGEARSILGHGYAEIPALGHVWSGIWIAIAGKSLWGTRFSSVAGSLLAIVAVFFLVRRLYGTWSATVTVVLLGVNHGFLHFSRIQHYMDPVPFQVLAVLGLLAGLETGRYGWFALSGATGGYSALTYHSGRITPLVMVLLTYVLLLRYPRALLKRWRGLWLCGTLLLGMLGPQIVMYATGRLNPFGRSMVYPFMVDGHVDYELLKQTIATGLPRVLGLFWFHSDTSTQYGAGWPLFFPASAALLGMSVAAALLRPQDIRAVWILLWALIVLFVGGVLTIDPPFWPRIVMAFIPATIAVAAVLGWLCRGATVAAGRVGKGIALVATLAVLSLAGWQQLNAYRDYCQGIRPRQAVPSVSTEWDHSIMGRDIQRWGSDAMMYIVAPNPNQISCRHPTLQYYTYGADVQDARDISRYLPLQDPRTNVFYVTRDMSDEIPLIQNSYPDAELRPFYNNIGRLVFTRVVIPAPHS